jgi:hypothetical protein
MTLFREYPGQQPPDIRVVVRYQNVCQVLTPVAWGPGVAPARTSSIGGREIDLETPQGRTDDPQVP